MGIGRVVACSLVGWSLGTTANAYDVLDVEMPNRSFDRLVVGLGGFVQPRFTWIPDDESVGSVGEISFSAQRVRLELEGDLLPGEDSPWGIRIRQKYSVELIPEPRLQDAWMEIGLGSRLRLRLGQFKAPIHRAILVSDANNLFPDRNQITSWVPAREIGMMVSGQVGPRWVEVQAGVFNGEGTNRIANVNKHFLYVGRVVFSPWGTPGASWEILRDWKADPDDARFLPTASLGYSIHYNVKGPPGSEEAYVGHNAEAFFHWRPLTVMGEFFWKVTDFEAVAVADYVTTGWYVQAGYFLAGIPWASEHVALMGRVEQGDAARAIDQEIPIAGPLDETQASRRYSMGLGLYAGRPLFEHVQDLRVVISYTARQELEGFPFKNDIFNVSTNLTF